MELFLVWEKIARQVPTFVVYVGSYLIRYARVEKNIDNCEEWPDKLKSIWNKFMHAFMYRMHVST